jgi:glutamate formiminotransferase/formiminotetrahydrofolate cyclodeaminase
MDAFAMPGSTKNEKAARKEAIDRASRCAIEVPLKVMRLCYESMEVMKAMAKIGNPNSISDAGVGALAACAGVKGAFLNVKINAKECTDTNFVERILYEGAELEKKAINAETEIIDIVNKKY